MNNQTQKYNFHVHGIHCNACVLMIESELNDLPNVSKVQVDPKKSVLEIVGDFGSKTNEEIAAVLTDILKPRGYTVSVEKKHHTVKWEEFNLAIPTAIIFAVLFVALQKMGIVNLVNAGNVTYGTAFVVGIVASLSTCMAVVGGLLLSMSATFAKEGEGVRPHIIFHIGRIISFFIFGGIIGVIGSAFTLNIAATFVMNLIIGIVMLVLGINLLDVFHWAKKLQPAMPKFISKHVHDQTKNLTKFNHTLTPLLIGVATFFLPCGFTQSMQLFTLSTGNFLTGALTMLAFALGTLPALSLISFSSFSIQNSSKAGVFFKAAGLIVILFAIFNLINSLVVVGVVTPIFNF